MNQRLEKLADRVLKENDRLTLNDGFLAERLKNITEEEKLRIIREEYAKLIEIDEHSLLVGEYSNVWLLEPAKVDGMSEERKTLAEKYQAYKNKLYISGGNHLAADFDCVLKNGISGLARQISEAQKNAIGEDQKSFLTDLYWTAQAAMAWSQAYVDALHGAAQKCESAERHAELVQMADICKRVPCFPARNFREALQSYYFTFILFAPDGLGRLDQYLYPYYINDIHNGSITYEDALALIEELFIKIFSWLGKNEARSGNNHGVVAGYIKDGECGHNACTSLILKAITEIPVWRPQISYRVTAKTTKEQLQEAVDAHCKRPDLIMFLNDDAILKGLLNAGVAFEDAVGYSSSGCNELVLTGCSQPGALQGHINIMYSLNRLLKDADRLACLHSFDDFYHAFEEYLYADLDIIFRFSCEKDALEAQPSIRSLLTNGCISSGKSITKGGAKYNFCTWCLTGLVNLADSMSTIRQMVFDEKRYTIQELVLFLDADWQGYEKQRAYIINNGRHFGNDDDYADLLINRVCASVKAFSEKQTPYRGGRYLFGTLTGYEISHIVFGSVSGASLDGRHAGEPFAASISAYPGVEKKGMTSYLKSAAKIDSDLLQSSVVVNLMLDKALVDSAEKRDLLTSVLRTYFKLGGIQLQINYLSADELVNAQREPEKYPNLRVRVTGFSGFFTSLAKDLQDEIIKRQLHTR